MKTQVGKSNKTCMKDAERKKESGDQRKQARLRNANVRGLDVKLEAGDTIL